MNKRPPATLNVDELLRLFSTEPDTAVWLAWKLHRYANRDELEDAITGDPRFREAVARILARLHEFKDAASLHIEWWAPETAAHLAPALFELWCAWRGKLSHAAGQKLLEIGERETLELMAGLAGKTPPEFRFEPLEALMRADVGRAYDRALPALALDPRARSIVLGDVTKEHVRVDGRWIDLALASLADTDRHVRTEARRIVDRWASPKAKAAIGAAEARLEITPQHLANLELYRRSMAALAAKLSPESFAPARADASKRLDKLGSLLGRVPAAARAFYECFDRIHVKRGKPRDHFIVVSLAEVMADARRWEKTHAPRGKPRALIEPFQWPVTPDGATKAGFSGGPAYGFAAPTEDDDPVLDVPRKPTFSKFVGGAARLRKKG
jgi:hypothetical protein